MDSLNLVMKIMDSFLVLANLVTIQGMIIKTSQTNNAKANFS